MGLTDQEILDIFRRLAAADPEQDGFIRHYAAAICQAPRRDFLILRPASLVIIAKYAGRDTLGNQQQQR